MKNSNKKYGFTLMELMVAVIIIAVLAAVAVPQYKKAVLKSRFSTLMPLAQSVAKGNEVYYLANGEYADRKDKLDVEGPGTNPEGTQVNVVESDDYNYVIASRNGLPNNYIVYQQHSVNFPEEVHCEAEDNNTLAKELCKSLGFTKDKGHILHNNYTTYTEEDGGHGVAPLYARLQAKIDCTDARAQGYTCTENIDEESGTATQTVCTKTAENRDVCFETRYNSDGSYLRYGASAPAAVDTRVAQYDKNGKLISAWKGRVANSENMTYGGYDYFYDGAGNLIGAKTCKSRDATSHECTARYGNDGYVYSYQNGQLTAIMTCSEMDATGNCSGSLATAYNLTYGNNGKLAYMSRGSEYLAYIYDNEDQLVRVLNGYNNTGYKLTLDDSGTGMLWQQCRSSSSNCSNGVYQSSQDSFCFDEPLSCFRDMTGYTN